MMTTERPDEKSSTPNGILGWVRQIIVFALIIAASLFIASGRLGWGMAWAYVGLFVVSQMLTALILIPSNPELLTERAHEQEDV